MINLPFESIIKKIKENSDLSEEEINQRINQKLKQLSGLISKEGAAHILANELGIKIFEVSRKNLKIKDIMEGMRDVEISGKVQQIYEVRDFHTEKGPGKVGSFTIADETGNSRIVCWHSQTEVIPQLVKDLTIKIVGGYVRSNNGRKEIHLNEKSKVIFNPKDVSIGEIKQYSSSRKNLSDISENDDSIEVLATIVQVFDPRFFEVCPECGKRARPRDDYFYCEEHGKIKPSYSYVMNILLDDGTETTRTIFFGQQMERLLNRTKEQILLFKDNLEKFEETKLDLLGKTIKVIGRVKKNEMFGRLEINANLVFTDVNPADEIRRFASIKQNSAPENKEEQDKSYDRNKSSYSEDDNITEEQHQSVEEEDIRDIIFNKRSS